MIDRRPLVLATESPVGARDATWYSAAWLTVPDTLRRPELQVVVHGSGCDHRAFDFPVEPGHYSYVAWAKDHGIATLNLDRIGCGQSTRPPGAETTIEAQASTLHQIIDAAKAGFAGAPPFERIVLVGASLGSVVSGTEAATYGDVDAVVLQSYMPVDGDPEVGDELFDLGFQPALERLPQLRGLIDDGYLATRQLDMGWLYRMENADPAMMAIEETISGTTTRAELAGAVSAGPAIRGSALPTLVMVGQYDPLMYDAGSEADSRDAMDRMAKLTPANFDYALVKDMGHGLALHRTAHQAFETMDTWLAGLAA
jgi:pimeloyl-ACP methyl ester carboxylesterase